MNIALLVVAIVVLLRMSLFAGVFAVGEQFGEHNMARLSLLRPAAARMTAKVAMLETRGRS